MAETTILTDALKRMLRARRITYEKVAKTLDLSEASVKRLFSRGGFTLERFEQICALAGTSLVELARESERGKDDISQLEPEQERIIMSDRKLFLIAVCALNHLTVDEITAHYMLTKAECIKLLLKLEQIRFLELLPENQIRLRVTHTFSWLPNGPIQQYFKARAGNDYFRSRFDQPNDAMLLVNGMLSESSRALITQKLKRLANEFAEIHEDEKHLPIGERRPATVILAVRAWELDEFKELRRPKTAQKLDAKPEKMVASRAAGV